MSENLINTLEVGHIIELDWEEENGIVRALKSEILEIPAENKCTITIPFHKGRFFPLHIGTRYKFFYNKRDTGVIQFQGLIIGREQIGNQHAMIVLRVSDFIKSQRRLFYRLAILADAVILVEDGVIVEKVLVKGKIEELEFPNYREIKCSLKDISGGGLKLQTSHPYDLESLLTCAFNLGGDDFKIKAIVKRCIRIQDVIERYDVGLQFHELDESDRSKIIAYVFDKQRNLLKKGLI